MVLEYESNADRIVREREERKAARAAQQARRRRQRDERKMAMLGKKGIRGAVKKGTLAKNPDALKVADRPTSPDVRRVADRPTSPDVLRVTDRLTSPDVRRVADRLTSPDVFIPSKRSTSGTGTRKAQPRSKPNPPRRPTVGGNMMGGIPQGGGTLSKKDIDEYSEAFESPDAEKMFSLAEKNRRKDMNMLERGFDSIIQAGERASAERRRQGKSDFDMNEDVYGMSRGGRLNGSRKNKPKGRKRAARRGFGVETRGS